MPNFRDDILKNEIFIYINLPANDHHKDGNVYVSHSELGPLSVIISHLSKVRKNKSCSGAQLIPPFTPIDFSHIVLARDLHLLNFEKGFEEKIAHKVKEKIENMYELVIFCPSQVRVFGLESLASIIQKFILSFRLLINMTIPVKL